MINIWLFLFSIFVGLILLTLAWSSISLAPFVPARKKDLQRILRLADLEAGQNFYELGCGDGRVVIYMTKNSAAKGVGVEITWPLWLICELKKIFSRNKKINFKFKDLFRENLSAADVVYFFGMPHSVKSKLQLKLKNELKVGAKVISYSFALPGWQPIKVDRPGEEDVPIYLYMIK